MLLFQVIHQLFNTLAVAARANEHSIRCFYHNYVLDAQGYNDRIQIGGHDQRILCIQRKMTGSDDDISVFIRFQHIKKRVPASHIVPTVFSMMP